jgi:cytoskeletal protein CcmA (bactofilin family)
MVIEIPSPSIIAEGTTSQGSLTFQSNAQVFGVVEGEILQQSQENLHIGKTGWVHGNITSSGPIIVEGRVDGNIKSNTVIRLAQTATVHGILEAPAIQVIAGAFLEGELKMRHAKKPLVILQSAA